MPDATARALLAVEAQTLTALHALTRTPEQTRRNVDRICDVLAAGRALARRTGAETMVAELRSLGFRFAVPQLPPLPDVDRLHAERAAAGLLKALDGIEVKKAEGKPVTARATIANKMALDATTETASAFADERQRIEVRIAREQPALAGVILKRWDARLDACPVCRGLHDTTRPLGLDFRGGKVPGKAHPRCRCITSFVPVPMLVPGAQRTQARKAPSTQWEWVD